MCQSSQKQELNLDYQAPRGVWIIYPVLGGLFSGHLKKHYITPIAKYHKFSQCGSRQTTIKVDGDWSPWSLWSSCSVSCGFEGRQKRFRTCDNPPPMGTGKKCVREMSQTKPCMNTERCPDFGR